MKADHPERLVTPGPIIVHGRMAFSGFGFRGSLTFDGTGAG